MSLLLVAASTLFKTRGNDIWWHIRTGRWIWEHGALPATDPFSHTFHGAPWHNADWISQLFFFWLHRAGGAEALVWAKAGIVLLTMLVLASLTGDRVVDRPSWCSASPRWPCTSGWWSSPSCFRSSPSPSCSA